jgi:hypothetical protein
LAYETQFVAGLQSYFREGRMLTATELRRVTDIFTKMFMDAHTKVSSIRYSGSNGWQGRELKH